LSTSADGHLLLDTSAAVAIVYEDSPFHAAAATAARGRTLGLAGHAAFEFISTVTRLPGGQRITGAEALLVIDERFGHSRFLTPEQTAALLRELVALDILGGAVYDGLIGGAARAHGLPLLTCDRRAKPVYDALGVTYHLIS
jgi:predicted nucleic acid-binding protein